MTTLDRLSEILGRPVHPSIQPCAPLKGALCVLVHRSGQPLKGIGQALISIAGPTPGSSLSDAAGIAEFNGLTPGEYFIELSLAGSPYDRWKIEPHSSRTVIGGGAVGLLEVEVTPTGTLAIEIMYEGAGAVVEQADALVCGSNTFELLVERGRHSSPDVPCGSYQVSVSITVQGTRFSLRPIEVKVPENGTGLAQFEVPPVSWIEIELVGEDGVAVPNEEYSIMTPNGLEFRGKTDEEGLARVNGIVPGRCEVRFPKLDADAWAGEA